MDLNELEAAYKEKKPVDVEVDEVLSDGEQARMDVLEALTLINASMTMMNYLSDPLLCKTVTKRERQIMVALAEQLRQYLGSVEPHYIDDEEAG